jgi:hypothetical protein
MSVEGMVMPMGNKDSHMVGRQNLASSATLGTDKTGMAGNLRLHELSNFGSRCFFDGLRNSIDLPQVNPQSI